MADIELVIKIPEEIYKASQIIDVKYEDVIQIPLEVIANGVPLPKRHGRLIDADEIIRLTNEIEEIESEEVEDREDRLYYLFLKTVLKDAPTITEAERSENNGNVDL